MKYGCIYRIYHIDTGKSYIGQTVNFKTRISGHLGGSTNKYLSNSIQYHGKDKFKAEILYDNIPEPWLNDWEIETIRKWNTFEGIGYNLAPGGGSVSGKDSPLFGKTGKDHPRYGKDPWNKGIPRKEETKIKISKTKKGKMIGDKNPMYGRNHSEESRRKMSKTRKGKYSGENNPMYGKQHSEEAKRKISEAGKGNQYFLGRKHSEETKRKISETKKARNKQKREQENEF